MKILRTLLVLPLCAAPPLSGLAQIAVAQHVVLPPGYSIVWSGQFEYLARAAAKLRTVIPVTLFVIFVLLSLTAALCTGFTFAGAAIAADDMAGMKMNNNAMDAGAQNNAALTDAVVKKVKQ